MINIFCDAWSERKRNDNSQKKNHIVITQSIKKLYSSISNSDLITETLKIKAEADKITDC